ncbi:M-phase inducer phosphatase 3 isoform X3 [Hemicordylus capensis]|uniref:M-phase inducer phosphatase 3 isoform X3 n=1 Tax=Hemicordylus capensis TaxID=884348 RepID=UPI002304C8C5|nr:M-phase inducer phosphatase 3 isoform X3 [Hemicordylus capensis]
MGWRKLPALEDSLAAEADVSRSRLGFRSSCRMVLNLFRDAEISLPFTPEPPHTPIANLAQGFRNLSTFAGDTPRRCLDLSNLSNGEEEVVFNFSQSPGTLETGQKGSKEAQDRLRGSRRQYAQLLQSQVLCSTPGTPSSICQVRREISSPSMNKENEGSLFKHPRRHMPRSHLFRKRPPDPPLTCYTIVLEAGGLEEYEMKDLGSPIAATTTQRMPEAVGDFPELCLDEQEETEKPLAGHLSSMATLLSGPLLTQDINVSEASMNKSRLFRSPSMPEKLNRPVLRRAVKAQDDETQVKSKRIPIQEEPDRVTFLKKTASLSDMAIVRALDEDHGLRQLIGDFSSVYALPTVTGRHQDLRYITSETVAALLHDQFQSLVEKFYIIDCRYPYEYRGGHIKGALNIHKQEDLSEFFLKKPLLPSTLQKRLILVFHCEFSSERGPKMCRYLREEDRTMNEYPALHYPELYVLQGGYKDFFLEYKELCEPQSYCPMRHQDFKAEMLKFRSKSKAWAGERRKRGQIARFMKL